MVALRRARSGLAGFAFLKSTHDVFVNLSLELLEVEEHEHGRADTLNLIDQRSVDISERVDLNVLACALFREP